MFRKALDEYRRSQEYVADFPSGSYNLANYYSKLNDMPKAEVFYRKSIEIDNLFYPAKMNLALLYYQQGKIDPAETLFNDLVSRHPEITEGYYYLALLYGEQKKYTEAIALLETAVTRPTGNPRIWYNLGLLYQMTGQDLKCESALVKGLSIDPCNYDILYALFSFNTNRNQRAKALPFIERLRSCYPTEKTVLDMYAEFTRGVN
jgi:tetratricopeptide (TPR) repeat protein